MIYFKENLCFSKVPGGPTFSKGGMGVLTFSGKCVCVCVCVGGGVQLLIPMETYSTCDFLEGSGPLSPS